MRVLYKHMGSHKRKTHLLLPVPNLSKFKFLSSIMAQVLAESALNAKLFFYKYLCFDSDMPCFTYKSVFLTCYDGFGGIAVFNFNKSIID